MIVVSKEIKIGAIAVLALILLYVGVNYIKGNKLFNNGRQFYAVYEQVEGLSTDKKVLLNGLPIGKVNSIDFTDDTSGRLLVGILVFNDEVAIPINSTAKIASIDLFGTRAITLILGDEAVYAESGDTIQSGIEGDFLTELSKKFKQLENKSTNLIESMDSTLYVVKKAFEDFDDVAIEVTGLIKDEGPRIIALTDNLISISDNLAQSNDTITMILSNFHQISDSLAKARISETMLSLNAAVKDMAEVMDKINKGEGTAGLLINDSALYNNLEKASADLDSLLIDVKANPGRYVQVSLWERKEKKKKE